MKITNIINWKMQMSSMIEKMWKMTKINKNPMEPKKSKLKKMTTTS